MQQLCHGILLVQHCFELLFYGNLTVNLFLLCLPLILHLFLLGVQLLTKVKSLEVSFYDFEEVLHKGLSQRSANGSRPILKLFDRLGAVNNYI